MANITQNRLSKIVRQRVKIEQLQEQLRTEEKALTTALKRGAIVRPGILTAFIKKWTRRNVAWKEKLVEATSQEHADRILNATRPDEFEKLVVETV